MSDELVIEIDYNYMFLLLSVALLTPSVKHVEVQANYLAIAPGKLMLYYSNNCYL